MDEDEGCSLLAPTKARLRCGCRSVVEAARGTERMVANGCTRGVCSFAHLLAVKVDRQAGSKHARRERVASFRRRVRARQGSLAIACLANRRRACIRDTPLSATTSLPRPTSHSRLTDFYNAVHHPTPARNQLPISCRVSRSSLGQPAQHDRPDRLPQRPQARHAIARGLWYAAWVSLSNCGLPGVSLFRACRCGSSAGPVLRLARARVPHMEPSACAFFARMHSLAHHDHDVHLTVGKCSFSKS